MIIAAISGMGRWHPCNLFMVFRHVKAGKEVSLKSDYFVLSADADDRLRFIDRRRDFCRHLDCNNKKVIPHILWKRQAG